MAQPILKRRLNPLLLVSTVAALSLLAGMSVIAQDRIAQAQQEKNEWKERFNEKNSTLASLRASSSNKSTQIASLNQTVLQLRQENSRLSSELRNKTEEIEQLEKKLEQERQISNFNQPNQDLVRELNNSLEVVCKFGDPSTGSNPGLAVSECESNGHQVGE